MNAAWAKFIPETIRNRLKGRHVVTKILGNTVWLLADRVLRMGLGLLVGVSVARYLGPSQWGLLNYAVAFTSLFAAFASFGIDSIVVRELVRYPEQRDEVLGTASILKALGGALVLGSASVAIIFVKPSDSVTLYLVSITAAASLFQTFDTIDLWFQSQVQSKHSVRARGITFFIIAAGKLMLVAGHAPLIAFAWINFCEAMLNAVALLIVYFLGGQRLAGWHFSYRWVQELLRDGWPLLLSGLAIGLYMKIDILMLDSMAGSKAVGIYSAAVRLSEAGYAIPSAIAASVFPSIIESKQANQQLYEARLYKLFRLVTGLAYFIVIPTAFLSPLIVRLLFGQAYAGAALVLSIHIWSAIFVFLGIAATPFWLAENLQKECLYLTLLGAVLNIALNWLWIPQWQSAGSALATLVSYGLIHTVALYFFKPTRLLLSLFMKSLARPLLPALRGNR